MQYTYTEENVTVVSSFLMVSAILWWKAVTRRWEGTRP